MTHVLLAVNGAPVSVRLMKQLARQSDLWVAADGGARQFFRAGLVPQVVIGDLDSLPVSLAKKIPPHRLIAVRTQQNNDLEKALSYLVKQGVTSCTLVGITGGRWDFSWANFLLLTRFAKKMQLKVVGEEWTLHVLARSACLTCVKGCRASLLPLTTCSAVSIEGFVYPLRAAQLRVGTTRTLSNQTRCSRVRISLKSGVLGVYLETKGKNIS